MLKRVLIGLLVLLLVPGLSFADDFAALQAKYLTLRNTDVAIKNEESWRNLGQNFFKFVQKNNKSPHVGQALLDAGIIYELLWKKTGALEDQRQALDFFESVPRDFPGDDFADDALLRAGDLLSLPGGNKDEARRRYLEIVDAYPVGDMVDVARSRLKHINDEVKSPILVNQAPHGLPLVIIDPGHGGEDLGAVGKDGLMEKDVALDVALKIQAISENDGTFQVRLTRNKDQFVPLLERTNLANDFEARLFVSLHANSATVTNLTGFETYYLDNADNKSSQKLAQRENQYFEQLGQGSEISYILSDLIQSSKIPDSITLAHGMQNHIDIVVSQAWGKQKNLGVKKAPFYVLVGTHIPSVLVEMFFINNPLDEKKLAEGKFRQTLAEGVVAAIKDFLSRKL